MVNLDELVCYTNQLLEITKFKDYCPNGLQLQGQKKIQTLVSGVTANLALIERAIELNADVLLVHHGFFWHGEDATITGMKYQRIRKLIQSEINLIAYHLPLDAHPVYGNNVQLAEKLGLSIDGSTSRNNEPGLLFYGKLETVMKTSEFASVIATQLKRQPLSISNAEQDIHTVAWCTGAAQNYISNAVDLGVDAFITGEISEQTVHIARECGIQFFSAGHHATERYGVQALAQHLSEQFDLQHHFVDIDNPA